MSAVVDTEIVDLVDGFARVHRDLRISVTDRCNFRCTYCMPADGLAWQPSESILTAAELARIARRFVHRYGFTAIRLTGGEPTVRADLPELVSDLARLRVDLSLTTNGSRLTTLAPVLAEAGLRRVNVSLDSLRSDRFHAVTRRDSLDRVVSGIRSAVASGLHPVKVNVVVTRGVNDDEIIDFARFGRDEGVIIRFIEFMPLDADHRWSPDAVVATSEIVDTIHRVFPLESCERGHSPARILRYADGQGEIGVIGSVTEPFCASCDRVRLTADGQLRSCLFATTETDLRAIVRDPSLALGVDGVDTDGTGMDSALDRAIEATVATKWAGHGISAVDFTRPTRSMSQIGG
ncbi:MAG: GTP 3',8-cyclase MoaA [Microthrixaceae bacterium]|jgi:cyclic pyranopterin phosphate synthase|nr:GTP 3',8-cyclase MoaA [Microthrixaceae bacterium]